MAVLILVVLNTFILLEFLDKKKKEKFEEIDVERINVVEKSGKIDIVFANKSSLPSPVTNGRVLYDPKDRGPGILIFNDDGEESGGYVFGNWGSHFSMDQYKQDQVLYMQVINDEETKKTATAGYWVAPQSDKYTSDVIDRMLDSINAIPDKQRSEQAKNKFLETIDSHNKVFVGKNRHDETGLFLFDKKTNPRLRAYVDTTGKAKIDYLDETGKVIYSLPN
ncbi:MAG: hypothetical protein ABI763_01095 [Bacteroidota bacterium]